MTNHKYNLNPHSLIFVGNIFVHVNLQKKLTVLRLNTDLSQCLGLLCPRGVD